MTPSSKSFRTLQALSSRVHAVANTPAAGTKTDEFGYSYIVDISGNTNADISGNTNKRDSTDVIEMKQNECYASTTSDIPLEANKRYGVAATDGTTTIQDRSSKRYGVAPATDAAQLDNAPETDEYDYVLV